MVLCMKSIAAESNRTAAIVGRPSSHSAAVPRVVVLHLQRRRPHRCPNTSTLRNLADQVEVGSSGAVALASDRLNRDATESSMWFDGTAVALILVSDDGGYRGSAESNLCFLFCRIGDFLHQRLQ